MKGDVNMEQEFDEKIKESLAKQRVTIPNRTEDVIRSTLDNLPEKKKRKPVGLLVAVCMMGIAATTFFSINPQTLADNAPILYSIQKHFSLDSQYVEVMDPTSLSQQSNGIKVTILNTVFDGVELLVSYKVESQKAFNDKPILFIDQAFINNKDEGWLGSNDEYGEFVDEKQKVYEGITRFMITTESIDWRAEHISNSIDVARLPEVFTLKLQIDRLGGVDGKIKGDWNFDVPISTLKAKGVVNEVVVNKQFSSISPNVELEKIIVTPTRIHLVGELDEENSLIDYLVEDETGKAKKWLGGEVKEHSSGLFDIRSYYENNGKEPKSLTIIPYRYNKNPDLTKGVPLNKEGVTTVLLDKKRSFRITKVIEKDGKTYLSYTSNYPISSYLPFILVDESGEQYFRNLQESTQASTGKEAVLVFKGNLLNKKLSVVNPNEVFYDKAIKVKIP